MNFRLLKKYRRIYKKLPHDVWLLISVLMVFFLLAGFTDFNAVLGRVWLEEQPLQHADALVVLGGGIDEGTGQLSFKTEERVRSATQIFNDGRPAPYLVVVGGKVGGNPYAEAPAMAELATSLGVSTNDLILEDQSQNTLENATNVMAIARQYGWQKLIVLTSDFHTYRACTFFRNAGAEVVCRAADRNAVQQRTFSRRLQSTKAVLREYAANLYYWLSGKL